MKKGNDFIPVFIFLIKGLWGSMAILSASGAEDPGSNPGKPINPYIHVHKDLNEVFLKYIAKYHINIRSDSTLFKQLSLAVVHFFQKKGKGDPGPVRDQNKGSRPINSGINLLLNSFYRVLL